MWILENSQNKIIIMKMKKKKNLLLLWLPFLHRIQVNSEILLAVSRSPLNEDVFAARSKETSSVEEEIRELQGQIYRLLLQVKEVKEFQNTGRPSE